VGKLKKKAAGFANPKGASVRQQPKAKNSSDHSQLEQLAVALFDQGKLQEVEAIYTEIIAVGTSNHIVYGNLSAILLMHERWVESIELLRKALQLEPNYPDAHNNLGLALHGQGDLAAAIASYNTALQLNPNHPEAHNNLGVALKEQGDTTAAIALYNTALQLNPNYPEAHNNLGFALQEKGNLTAAIASCSRALKLRPNYPEAHYNLGIALNEQGDLTAAIASYNRALLLKPDHPDAHNNLGIALQEQGDLDAAIASYNTALRLKPNHPDAYNNLGNALQEQGDLNAAIASYNSALQLKPYYPEAHKNLGNALLAQGDYERGWELYEWRFKCKKDKDILTVKPICDQWSGEEITQDSQLLLVTEQGLGDTLQFMRYANALRKKGASVSLCAEPKLHTLIQASGIDPSPLTPQQANQVKDGLWTPLLSVPRYLGVSPKSPIITEPYIRTTDEFIAKWQGLLAGEKRPIIGINWQGNRADNKKTDRNILPHYLVSLASRLDVSLISLQRAPSSSDNIPSQLQTHFTNLQPQINALANSDKARDFLEYAAVIANCDLIITSGTTVAHLAGGMGITTWVLLKKVPEWRWGLEGDTTFWYPSMRLFRQSERGNWDELMERVAAELQKHFFLGGGKS
jgi:tetratricopeptide (TPR) repeat protein